MSMTRYNPEQLDGKRFNTDPPWDFKDITEQERDEALERLDELVETTREQLQED
jgi:hypothetical protein